MIFVDISLNRGLHLFVGLHPYGFKKVNSTLTKTNSNDIEFFISQDRSQIGVSVAGLAKLCGVSETTVRGVLAALSDRNAIDNNTQIHPILQSIVGVDPYLRLDRTGGTQIVRSEVCTKIIEYHAQRAKNPLPEAKQALDRFAAIGFENWVVQTIDPYANLQDERDTISTLIRDIQDLKQQMADTRGYQKVYTAIPGLRHWMESIADGRFNRVLDDGKQLSLLPEDAKDMTIREWLQYHLNGKSIPKGKKHTLANMVASAYSAMFEAEPPMVVRKNVKGYKLPAVKAYPIEALGLIENCWRLIDEDDNTAAESPQDINDRG